MVQVFGPDTLVFWNQ